MIHKMAGQEMVSVGPVLHLQFKKYLFDKCNHYQYQHKMLIPKLYSIY